jgi:hypothetical protein
MENYKREDKFDEQTLEQLAYHYKEVLEDGSTKEKSIKGKKR